MATEVVIGRGKVYVAERTEGQAIQDQDWVFIGNCPEFGLEMADEVKEHQDFTEGLKTIDDEITIFVDLKGTFTTDNMSSANLALFFRGLLDEETDVIRMLQVFDQHYGVKLVENNPKGVNRIFFVPKTRIAPNGKFDLISDDFRKASFNIRSLKDSDTYPDAPFGTITASTTTTTTTTTL